MSFFIHEEGCESSPDVAFELYQNLEDQESVVMFSRSLNLKHLSGLNEACQH